MEDTANSPSKPTKTSNSWVPPPFINLVVIGIVGISLAMALQVCILKFTLSKNVLGFHASFLFITTSNEIV